VILGYGANNTDKTVKLDMLRPAHKGKISIVTTRDLRILAGRLPAKMLNLRDLSAKILRSILTQTRRGRWSGRLLNKNSVDQVFPVDLRTSHLLDAEGELMGLLGVATPVQQYNISDEIIQQLVEQHQVVLSRELYSMLENALITTDATAHSGSHGTNNKRDKGKGSGNSQLVPGIGRLSARELEVFTLIGRGLGTSEIGKKLGVSAYTVQTHRNHIKGKLNLPRELTVFSFNSSSALISW
jgi:DNA-binding CsgD family transcriptional regulator